MVRDWRGGRTWSSLFLVVVLCELSALSAVGATQETTLETYLKHFVRSGSWILEPRADHSADEPRWVQNYRWGPARNSAYVDSYSLSEDGTCVVVWHTFYRWDASLDAITVQHVGPGEAYLTGVAEMISGTRGRITLQGTLPNGVPARFRDVRDRSQRSSYTAQGHSWNAESGTWEPTESDPVTWRYQEKRLCVE